MQANSTEQDTTTSRNHCILMECHVISQFANMIRVVTPD